MQYWYIPLAITYTNIGTSPPFAHEAIQVLQSRGLVGLSIGISL